MMAVLQTVGFFGPAVLVTALTSAFLGFALRFTRRGFDRLAPAAQSRLLFAAAMLPLCLGAAFFGSAVADWLQRGPAEFCAERAHSGHVSTLLIGCALALWARAGIEAAGLAANIVRSQKLTRTWTSVQHPSQQARTVLPCQEPQAFVMGLFHPRIFVSQGLLAAANSRLLEPLLAHEAAHVRRRDPLRRLMASIGLLVHLPGVANGIHQLLARAQEMAADAEAVKAIGDGPRVAESLVWFARQRFVHPESAFEFAKADIGERVRRILEATSRRDAPSRSMLLALGGGIGTLVFLSRHHVHHLSEILLRLP